METKIGKYSNLSIITSTGWWQVSIRDKGKIKLFGAYEKFEDAFKKRDKILERLKEQRKERKKISKEKEERLKILMEQINRN